MYIKPTVGAGFRGGAGLLKEPGDGLTPKASLKDPAFM